MKQKWISLGFIIIILLSSGFLVGKGISTTKPKQQTRRPLEPKTKVEDAMPARNPAVAGQFYPAEPDKLRAVVDHYLAQAKPPQLSGELIALIAPHAGYVYSATTAAHAFKLLEGQRYDTIILLGGSHVTSDGVASVYDRGAFSTPLGEVAIDEEMAAKILEYSTQIDNDHWTHDREHSLEVELPFIQKYLPDVRIVPIMIKRQTLENAKLVAAAILSALEQAEQRVLIVNSTDMSHYFPRKVAAEMDQLAIEDILAYNTEKLNQDLLQRKTQLCGQGAVMTTMLVAQSLGADQVTKLHYSDSADASKDTSAVVGYVAMAFTASQSKTRSAPAESQTEEELDERAKQRLLEIARKSVTSYIQDGKLPKLDNDIPLLNEKWGAFVTINKNERLRGCIGRFTPVEKPLYLIVQDMALAAAINDQRFPVVTAAELDQLSFEISVLSPMRRINDINEIEVGKHGLYIIKGYNRGVLLPQVATDYDWDRETFLNQTCRKAGLPERAWQEPGTEIYTFSAQVFHESK